MISIRKKLDEKPGITYFGLLGHEVALLKSTVESAPDLAAGYELREPNRTETCDIVVVNQDSDLAMSWWKTYKKRNPTAVPLFLTDSKDNLDDGVYSKRPLSPSVLRAAVQSLVSKISS